MKLKIARAFIFSAGVILVVTGAAKIISANGSAHILQSQDPIIGISFRQLFWLVGLLELVVGFTSLIEKRIGLQAGLVACLSTGFAVYRFSLIWIGYQRPCSCLGNLTDALHIPPQTADSIMRIVLVYLLVGSYSTLLCFCKGERTTFTT